MPIRITPAVKTLLITCFAAFIVQQTADQFMGGNLLSWFGLVPAGVVIEYRFWQLFTYTFLHGDVFHLFFNLMMVAMIGGELEAIWGTARFLRYFFFCSGSAGILYLLLQLLIWKDAGLHVPMVGASGAIYGLLMAYGLIFGERVLLFMMLFSMKAKHMVWILAGIEFMSTVYSGRSGLSSAAHLGGMFAGFAFLWGRAAYIVAKKRRAQGQNWLGRPLVKKDKKRRGGKHLKLVIDNEKESDVEKKNADGTPRTWH